MLHHIAAGTKFAEICAGKGDLIRTFAEDGIECVYAIDIKPRAKGVERGDALELKRSDIPKSCEIIITNPPWTRELLHPIIERCLSVDLPAWLLFDADWMHNRDEVCGASPPYLLRWCRKIVSIGRVKWFPNSDSTGKDNCCWYLFDPAFRGNPTFHSRRGG